MKKRVVFVIVFISVLCTAGFSQENKKVYENFESSGLGEQGMPKFTFKSSENGLQWDMRRCKNIKSEAINGISVCLKSQGGKIVSPVISSGLNTLKFTFRKAYATKIDRLVRVEIKDLSKEDINIYEFEMNDNSSESEEILIKKLKIKGDYQFSIINASQDKIIVIDDIYCN